VSAAPRSTRWAVPAVAVALLAGTSLLYARVSSFGFTYFDDPRYVTENARVLAGLSWDNASWAFTTFHFSNWHPLTWLSYMLDVELFGPDPGALHLVSAALHAANAALLFLVLHRATGALGRSAFVAVLFAVHPLQVESVAWVSERKEVLSTLFGLLALLAHVRHAARRTATRYALVALAFALSLMAKPTWVTLPFLLLLLDAWPLQRVAELAGEPAAGPARFERLPLRVLALEKAPLLALSLASSLLTVIAQNRGGAVVGLELRLGVRLANAAVSYLTYLAKVLWPARLAAFYPFPGSWPAWEVAGSALVLLGLTTWAVRSLRAAPWFTVGWLWFVGTLVPMIGLVQVGGQAMADRYTYLPSIGLFLAGTWGACEWAARRGARVPLRVVAVTVAALLAALTWRQAGYWSDHVTLFRHAIAVTGPNARAHAFLSDGLRKAGRHDEALAEAREAIRIEPWAGRFRMNLAIVEVDLGRLPAARRTLEEALRLDPRLAFARALLGEVETALGRPEVGERLLAEAAGMAPDDADIADRLARVRAYRASTGR
jgi:protein O-mannosyl-transferase